MFVGAVQRAEAGDATGLYDLKVEHLRNPIQLDIKKPRLSWKIRSENPVTRAIEQQSYQILVASSEELLTDDKADLWNSQRVESSQSVLVPYEVPANTTATLLIPKRQGKTLLEDDQEFTGKMNSVTEGNRQWWQLEIGSGTYRFRVK